MKKPNGYEEASTGAQFETLEPGGYVCTVRAVKEVDGISKDGNAWHKVEVALDIAEGEHKGYMQRRFDADTRAEKKWPAQGRLDLWPTKKDGTTNGFFKAFVEACKASGYEPEWNDNFAKSLKGATIGVLFRNEAWENADNMKRWTAKPFRCITADDLRAGKFTVPDPKDLDESSVGFRRPVNRNEVSQDDVPEGFEAISDDDIPF